MTRFKYYKLFFKSIEEYIMTSTKTITGDSVSNLILEWSESNNRHLWIRDALRRIVENGELTSDDEEELLDLCKRECGDDSITLEPVILEKKHFSNAYSNEASVQLKSLSEVIGVNLLQKNQTLEFEHEGITVVYGNNGTGKSGYTRVLKKACRSRKPGNILPNVFGSTNVKNATAKLEIQKESGTPEIINWKDTEDPPEVLSAITVFDKDSAEVHASDENKVWFQPFGLDIPDKLTSLCEKFKIQLKTEEKQLKKAQNKIFETPIWEIGEFASEIGKFMSSLSHTSDITNSGLDLSFKRADAERLDELLYYSDAFPYREWNGLVQYGNGLEAISKYLSKLQHKLGTETQSELFKLKQIWTSAREASKFAAKKAFSKHEIEGIGNPVWKLLWDAASNFSKSLGEGKIHFPPKVEEICVLCHQKIDKQTAQRMNQFEEFIKSDTQFKAEQAESDFTNALELFNEHKIRFDRISLPFQNLKKHNSNLAKKVARSLAKARKLQCKVNKSIENMKFEISELDFTEVLSQIYSESDSVFEQLDVLRNVKMSKAHKAMLNELANLKDRKQSSKLMKIAKDEIIRLKKLHIIEKCIKKQNTASLTKVVNKIADEVISDHLKEKFKNEINKLVNRKIKVELNRVSAKGGIPRYQVNFFGIDTESNKSFDVPNVLSEGEQRCVALASYLTELSIATHKSCLVFDDPVSSLDTNWRENIARRLVEETFDRQIIIFTHDLVFLTRLQEIIRDCGIPSKFLYLTRGDSAVGIVRDELPWRAMKIPHRIDDLRQRLGKLRKIYETDEERYHEKIRAWYSDLRATWESALEATAFAGVIGRFRNYISQGELRKVTALDIPLAKKFQLNFSWVCDFVNAHDTSPATSSYVPSPDKADEDLNQFVEWREELLEKRNKVK